MKKILIAVSLTLFSFVANAQDYKNFVEGDNILGKITAPVSFIEYASMTCGHCAAFDKEVVQKLKKEYVDTGKVAYTLRDFPLDDLAVAVAKVNRCAPKDMFYKYVSAFFMTQRQWLSADDKLEAITSIAKMGGMTSEDVQKCILDPKLQKDVMDMKNSGLDLGLNSTPSFMINGEIYKGNLGYERIKALIDAQLDK
jgi:protein-disulfide isomerase